VPLILKIFIAPSSLNQVMKMMHQVTIADFVGASIGASGPEPSREESGEIGATPVMSYRGIAVRNLERECQIFVGPALE
jgi:hypothetical protein